MLIDYNCEDVKFLYAIITANYSLAVSVTAVLVLFKHGLSTLGGPPPN